jgi:hypothetical protein
MSRHYSPRVYIIVGVSLAAAIGFAFIWQVLGIYNGQNRPGITYGMAVPDLVAEPENVQKMQLTHMKSIGITSVRVDANWRSIQPLSPTTYDWKTLDREVDLIRFFGMSIDLVIDDCPSWAALPSVADDPFPQPASSNQYATWAAAVVKRYAPKGVEDYEIWNEPNLVRFWQPKPNPAAYAADLIAAYKSIKEVDRTAFIISGGLARASSNGGNYSPISFLASMYTHGIKGSFDALGYHPYSSPSTPDIFETWSAWSQMAETKPSIRSVMAKNDDSKTPIWITEYGAPSSGPAGVGEQAQSADISQALTYVKNVKWIGALYIYTWQDSPKDPSVDNWYGLLTANGSRKDAYFAVASALKGLIEAP